MDYECGRCTSSDCRGNPAYFDPDCPVHRKKQITPDEIKKAVAFFKKLAQELSVIDYDPCHPIWATKHLAAKHGKVLGDELVARDPALLK